MKLYAIKIRKSDLALIALLNNGVTPKIEKTKTYFIFDSAENSEYVPQIITERKFLQTCDIMNTSPLLLAIKQD
jgi:hypothetical protein